MHRNLVNTAQNAWASPHKLYTNNDIDRQLQGQTKAAINK